MPQPDAKPNAKGAKKLPKAALPIGAVAVVLLVLYLKKKSAAANSESTTTNQEQLNRQSFIPVTGENVAGVGASGGGVSSGGVGESSALMEFLKLQQSESRETRQSEHEFLREVVANLGTGGGAPTTNAAPGVNTAPAPAAATPAGPAAPQAAAYVPPAAAKAPTCPSSFPHLNGRTPSRSTCYQNITCGNGCAGHRYQDGHTECQTRNSKHQCVW